MRRLYRHLVVLSGIAITVATATHAPAQDASRANQHQAAAVRHARHVAVAEPELISSGSYVEGATADGTYVDGEMMGEAGACCDNGCGAGRCGRQRKRRPEGANDPWYNCSCNGSYKFPVPPLYTYHWPGMYSQELMTNYHSPWRFPPLRPYEDEPVPEQIDPQARFVPGYLPVSHQAKNTHSSSARRPGSPRHSYETYSAKIERFYGTAH